MLKQSNNDVLRGVFDIAVLIVVAHPDDEVLGAGGMIFRLAKTQPVYTCILCGEAGARSGRPDPKRFNKNIMDCNAALGVSEVFLGGFPNIRMNTVAHLELVQFIEQAIVKTGADRIFTHHPNDLNNDHLHTSLAAQAAARLFQRREGIPALKELSFMEIPSSTEWSINPTVTSFRANSYFAIGEDGLNKKIELVGSYDGIMRDYPHPRSREYIRALATIRGAEAGIAFAEAFETVFLRKN